MPLVVEKRKNQLLYFVTSEVETCVRNNTDLIEYVTSPEGFGTFDFIHPFHGIGPMAQLARSAKTQAHFQDIQWIDGCLGDETSESTSDKPFTDRCFGAQVFVLNPFDQFFSLANRG